MVLKTVLYLSTSMIFLRSTLAEICKFRILVLQYHEVSDFAKINTFELFLNTFPSSDDPYEAGTHLEISARVKQYPLIPIPTRDNQFFVIRSRIHQTRNDFRFLLM